ncbi:MAG: NTP transferase domain-containing protein [Lachnospiraceae bacterium]|nr:NTP transferase domain-containing protein [Lachnospiraceae bacterium]
MIHLIQPMGGGGTRFGNKGFNVPKPLIMLQGRPFFYWAVRSVTKFMEPLDITFVVLKDHVERFNIDDRIKEYFPGAKITVIPEVLPGAVLTCLEGVKSVEDDMPLLFNDCDHAFVCSDFYDYCMQQEADDGALLTFKSSLDAYSYVKYENGRAVGTVEKQVVSDRAICGAYFFKNRQVFEKYSRSYLDNCSYSEYFVSGVYNELAADGGSIRVFGLDENISFGTPDEFDEAEKNTALKDLLD